MVLEAKPLDNHLRLYIMYSMVSQIRNIPPETWHKFKIICAVENVSMNTKLLQLIHETVEAAEDEQKQIARAFSKGLKKAGKK